jgi:hypothetical protein
LKLNQKDKSKKTENVPNKDILIILSYFTNYKFVLLY